MENNLVHDQQTYIEALHNLRTQGKLEFTTFSDDWVVKFWRPGAKPHFMLCRLFDINSQAAAEIATDKVATYALLADAKLSAVPHILLTSPNQTLPAKGALPQLFTQYRTLVIKPTQGRSGHDVTKCDDAASAQTVCKNQLIPSWAASPFVDARAELRIVVYRGNVEVALEKIEPQLVNGLKMFNLSLGAQARHLPTAILDPAIKNLAIEAMDAIGLRMGAVDILVGTDDSLQILEINSRFSIEHFASMSAQNHREVVAFYERVITDLVNSRT